MLGFTPNRAQLAAGNCCGVMCQTSLMFEETYSKGKRDRDLESVRTLSQRKDLHVYLEQKADLAVRQGCAAQSRLSEADADMETRKCEKRSSDMALYETSCIKLINGLIRLREKGSVLVEKWK